MRTALFRFLALGALLFALDRTAPSWPGFTAMRAAGPAEVTRESDEALLAEEARRLGLDATDAMVQRRLLRDMDFLSGEEEIASDGRERVAAARALGLAEEDLVVRRRLAQRMQLLAEAAVRARPPGESELAEQLAREADRFALPPRVRLSQLFLPKGEETRAKALLRELRATGRGPDAVEGYGAPFPVPAHLPLCSERELARRLGPGFARAASRMEPGSWQGPIASSYGLHLVWVHERTPERPARLDEVRSQVRESLLAERTTHLHAQRVAALRRAAESLR